MSDELSTTPESASETETSTSKKTTAKRVAAEKAPTKKAVAKKSPAKKAAASKTPATSASKSTTTKKAAAKKAAAEAESPVEQTTVDAATPDTSSVGAPEASAPEPAQKRSRKKAVVIPDFSAVEDQAAEAAAAAAAASAAAAATSLMFQAPTPETAAPRRRTRKSAAPAETLVDEELQTATATPGSETDDSIEDVLDAAAVEEDLLDEDGVESDSADPEGDDEQGPRRRRRRRGGRGRRRRGGADGADADASDLADGADLDVQDSGSQGDESSSNDDASEGVGDGSHRRRRRRRRGNSDSGDLNDDPPNTVVRVREPRSRGGDTGSLKGSTRLEAKKQRRREGREAGRRRPSILTEAEFLARREAVDRVMVVRQRDDRTQIAVLEDNVLVEHYVNRSSGASMIGNVYLGRVQNVLPSMEAAFIDVGRGRNAVLYAGEVNWDATGLDGSSKRIELALKPGDPVLVQVSKDPVGHKGARLTAQISLPGRFLVFVPNSSMTGISRKLPDNERSRLKSILRAVLPEDAGVIVRTAAEGASEEELRQDVERLAAQWEEISAKAKESQSSAPVLLHGEPDLAIKVVRDIFNEDFGSLVVEGGQIADTIRDYVGGVAPDLATRITTWVEPRDLFASYRIDEQLAKALERKVWLPSGGSLVIDRTEAMTVVDVNTGKFTGQGGNLEETVTSNNLEAAEEIVRQLRLRDIGGIIVIDFIDMVLESNRDQVLRRLVECLGRDRTKHQVAEVTSLGLVQMTRKRIGQGLLEVFSEQCEACHGRGYHIHSEPVAAKAAFDEDEEPSRRHDEGGRSRSRGRNRAVEVEPRAIDPEVSAVLERIHAAAAKSGAVPADSEAADVEAADVEVTESETAEPAAQVAPTEPSAGPEAELPLQEQAASPSRKRGSRRATRATGSSPVTSVTDTVAEPIIVVSAPAPAVVTVTPQVSASLVELDPTPAPRARGPRKATRSAGPASNPAGAAAAGTSETASPDAGPEVTV